MSGKLIAGAAAVTLAGVMVFLVRDRGPTIVQVRVPELSAEALRGKEAFDRRCARCHGADAGGSADGPPLVHSTYRPAHHADVAFELAVRRGVQAHHWTFGNMPPQPDATPSEVVEITRYARELQRANGIF